MNPIDKIPFDKRGHMITGALIWAFAIAVGLTVWAGIVVAAVIGAAKEIYDFFHRDTHTPDIWDWVATVSLPIVMTVSIYMNWRYT